MLSVNEDISIPTSEFEFRFSRSPGPGGQNVNKLNTRVTLRWRVEKSIYLPDAIKQRLINRFGNRINKQGEFLITSHRFRDQGKNVSDCLNKLREMILSVVAPPKTRVKTKPSRASKIRRLESKRRQADKKKSRRNPLS